MFNTFQPERLQEAIGAPRCAFGMPFVQATLDGDGRLKVAIGAGGQKTIMSRQRWGDVFNAAGLPSALEAQMPLWLRCHVPLCVAFESVSVAEMVREALGARGVQHRLVEDHVGRPLASRDRGADAPELERCVARHGLQLSSDKADRA